MHRIYFVAFYAFQIIISSSFCFLDVSTDDEAPSSSFVLTISEKQKLFSPDGHKSATSDTTTLFAVPSSRKEHSDEEVPRKSGQREKYSMRRRQLVSYRDLAKSKVPAPRVPRVPARVNRQASFLTKIPDLADLPYFGLLLVERAKAAKPVRLNPKAESVHPKRYSLPTFKSSLDVMKPAHSILKRCWSIANMSEVSSEENSDVEPPRRRKIARKSFTTKQEFTSTCGKNLKLTFKLKSSKKSRRGSSHSDLSDTSSASTTPSEGDHRINPLPKGIRCSARIHKHDVSQRNRRIIKKKCTCGCV